MHFHKYNEIVLHFVGYKFISISSSLEGDSTPYGFHVLVAEVSPAAERVHPLGPAHLLPQLLGTYSTARTMHKTLGNLTISGEIGGVLTH